MQPIESKEILDTFYQKKHYYDIHSHSYSDVRLSKFMLYNIKVSHYISNKTRNIDDKLYVEVAIVVMNLTACINKGKVLDYSRNTKHSKKSRYNKKGIRTKNIIKAIDILEKLGYVVNTIASNKQDPRSKRMSSFIQPSQKFIEEFCSNDEALFMAEAAHVAANEVIILRDVNKNDVSYTDCRKSKEARRVVEELNRQSLNHTFTDGDGNAIDNTYVRIFNMGDSTFESGGRFYRGDIQCLNNKQDGRLYMRINNTMVTEVDFSNLHIRMLADLHGIKQSSLKDQDLYLIPLSDDEITGYNRWLIKQSVNIMFNSTSERLATKAIDFKMQQNSDKKFTFSSGKDVVRAIKAGYPWLAGDFCQPIPRGHYLMNLDSRIAHHVVEDFIKDNKPICIVHDSFVVQGQDTEKLIYAMTNSYGKVVAGGKKSSVHLKVKWLEQHPLADDRIGEELITVPYCGE